MKLHFDDRDKDILPCLMLSLKKMFTSRDFRGVTTLVSQLEMAKSTART